MSILVAAGGTNSVGGGVFMLLLPAVAVLVAAGAGVWAGLFHARSLAGPPRVPPGRPVWPLVLVVAAAVGMWLLVVPGLYLGYTQGRNSQANIAATSQPIDGQYVHLAPQDLMVLGLL